MAPMLFDQMFMLVEEPNRHELHAWVWKENPAGTFAGFNPDVTCAAAVPDTALPTSVSWPPIGGIGLVLVSLAAPSATRLGVAGRGGPLDQLPAPRATPRR